MSSSTPVRLQHAIVKSVQSGDSIIVRGQPKGGPPPEKQINLAYLIAPKISRKMPDGSYTADEPFAWEAREFLRKKLVGKEISFRIEYKVPFGSNQRECATVFLGTENINESLVSEGLVEVVKRSQNKDNPDVVRLLELEESCKALASKGKWGGNPIKRNILQDIENGQAMINQCFDGIVEHVRDGSTMRVGLFIPPIEPQLINYQMTTVMLSGVRCPQTHEPFGEEARFFTESRLLQRDVKVLVQQTNPGGNLNATVTFMDRDIAEYLLREGYAKCMDRTLALTPDPKKLRALESEAKSKKLRVWRDFKDMPKSSGSSMNFEAKVMEISSADALVVQVVDTKEMKKIFLASIRSPKLDNKIGEDGQTVVTGAPGDKKQFRPLYDIPFMFEAREFLRKKIIGKPVKVKVDYVQPKTENYPEKICCTVIYDNQNIAEQLILNGLATVVKYRQDEYQRASDYDSYLAAEQKAQKSNKGLHSNKSEAGLVRIADLSMDLTKAKSFAPFLTRTTGVKREAVVEYVFPSSTKLKVYIPKENCLINLVLSGVNTPKPNDPILSEAVSFVRQRVLHRDVHIEIETADKVGNFIGSVYYDKNNNLALELIRNGLLSVREYNKNIELNNAEQEAKAARRGIWKDYKEEVAPETIGEDGDTGNDENEAPVADDLAQRKRVIITNLSKDFTSFHAQQVKDGPEIEALLIRLRQEATANPPVPGSYKPKKGDLVMAKFSEDGLWYRARVDKIISPNESQVIYIDYGNREILNNKDIALLPLGNFASIPAAAKEYGFAFVYPDSDPEIIEEVRDIFMEATANKVLLLKVEYKDAVTNLDAATLLDETTKKDVVLQMVKDGWLFVDLKTRRDRRLLKKLNEYKEAQTYAKNNGLNLWKYGDVTPDDAKEFGYPTR